MSFPDHFSTVSDRYAQHRPRYPEALVHALADRAPLGVAWDVGCGSGQLSVGLAARFERVIATDPSASQLAEATSQDRVEYRCVSAEDSGLASASASLVVAAQAAHWFDWARFVAEADRVAAPGALIALVAYGRGVVPGDAGRCVDHFYEDIAGPYWPPQRAQIERGYRDLEMPWAAVDAPELEMTASWTRDDLLGYLGTWSATTRLVADQGLGPVEALHARMQQAWPGDEARTVRWPLTIRLARR